MADRTGSHFSVETPAAVIHGERFGDGPPVVLLHGGPGCYDYFLCSALVDWLAETHTVYCYDQRGCRDSRSAGPFTMPANVADLEAIRRFIGEERISLLGHSAGASLAVHYAAAHAPHVGRLILVSPAGVRGGWRSAFDATLRSRMTIEQRKELERIDRRILRAPDRSERAELYRLRFNVILPCYVDPRHRGRAPTMEHYHRDANVQVNASIQASYRDRSWEAGLKRFRRGSCIIHGRSDPIPWSVVDELSDLLPGTAVFPLEHCGHFPWLEEPDACRAALFAFFENAG
ncbi:MAG: alpha/beta hydrolase [Phycisphaerae bacterium]|nr:alpha/beta hydrolase [Phycisphaerae bacterium]